MLAAKPCNEDERLAALYHYDILDTPDEQAFDDVTQLIAQICEAPIAVVNFVDRNRQWFKSETGLGVRETPLDNSLCAHAILQSDLLIVPDTMEDARFVDNALVTGEPHLRFYAGALLKSADGLPLGTLCVLDYRPRGLTDAQQNALNTLSRQVMTQLELRIANRRLREEAENRARQMEEIETLNVRLRRAMQETHHRVKNNLQVISALVELQMVEADTVPTTAIARIGQHARALAAIHDLLTQETRDHLEANAVSIQDVMAKLIPLLAATVGGRRILADVDDIRLSAREGASLALLVSEIVSNAIKHGGGDIEISLKEEISEEEGVQSDGNSATPASVPAMGRLEVCDDGPGFPPDFDPVQAGNTGLGLIDATGRYDLHGEIMYENRQEGGGRVVVRFPIPALPASAA